MKRYLLFTALLVLPSAAVADEIVECAATCSEDQAMISSADGNTVSCRCAMSAEMDPTVEDPQYEGTGGYDPGQLVE